MNPPSPSGAPSTLPPGMRLGAFEILDRLGAGGMGDVYRAKDTRLGREVALKIVSLDRELWPDALPRFEREARSASALNHPNIVTIYEFGNANGLHYIAMELVVGQTLRALLASGPIPPRTVIAIAAQIAEGLSKAHEAAVVHRDLKPENLMVSSDGTAKILDFGLAKFHLPGRPKISDMSATVPMITQKGEAMGTVAYMSPEQLNDGDVDFRSDQFSFGSVLYEMVTGLPAFRKDTPAGTMAAILRDEPGRIAAKASKYPAPFLWIVDRCLSKNPNERYSSTRDLAHDLITLRDRIASASAGHGEPCPSNLPAQRTAFIGREREADALRQLLSRQDVRLVTCTGPGGIGKTRLALHVAGEIAEQFPGGIRFVALSAVDQPEMVASAITQAAVGRGPGNPLRQETLGEYLSALDRPMLLLLDNFEHLVSAASVVADLLSLTPLLKIVTTSRVPLHLYGEHEFPVPPLSLPDAKSVPSLETLCRLPAIALFVERAKAVKRDFALTSENAAAVAAICTRLDGLPLAIELAAARIKLLSPAAIMGRLESCLDLLTGGASDLPARQRTLRGAVEWSYRLLSTPEQILFRRLSVFVGGCTLDGVEAVCDTRQDLGLDVLDGVASLVDKSLAQQVEQAGGEPRIVLLSTIREYALEQLAESAEEPATRRAHAAYHLVLAEECSKESGATELLDRLELEHDNLRAALDYLIKTGDADWGQRLGSALFRFWENREHLTEGRDYITRLLQLEASAAHMKLRARLLFAGLVLASEQGDYRSAHELGEASLKASVELSDDHGVVVALNALAVNATERGDLSTASLLFERCLDIWRDVGGPSDIARALSNLANVMRLQRKYSRAYSLYNECRAMFTKAGDEAGVAWTLIHQGKVASEKRDRAAARAFYEESLAAFRRLRDDWGIATVLADLASLCREEGDNSEAQRLYGESIRMFQNLGHKRGVARLLECFAAIAAAQSNAEHSLCLAGAAAALRQQLGAPPTSGEQAKLESELEAPRQMLGGDTSVTAWMKGWAMPVEQAVETAIAYDAGSARPNLNPV